MKSLLKISVFGFFLLSTALQAQESTLVYTLKDNERIIYLSEHRLLISNTGVGHLLFIQRPAGYFILFNKKEFGPYQDIQFSESNSSLFDWAVSSNGKWYQLILDHGLLLGPYEYVVDVYRPIFDSHDNSGATIENSYFGFRAQRGKSWYVNVNGKEYGPYKEDNFGTPYFVNKNGFVMAYTDSEYQLNVAAIPKGDSIRVGPVSSKLSTLALTKRELSKNGTPVLKDVVAYTEDITRTHFLAADASGSIYLDGKPTNTVKPELDVYGGVAYGIIGPRGVFPTGEYFYTYKKDDTYFYFISNRKESIQIPEESLWSVCFSKDGSHVAYSKGYEIMVDDKKVHDRGFSLVYNPGVDGFSWLSVKDRSIYVHTYKP